ncbi:hypothetical protein V6N12_074386 [Hibiscus sabdariffa]|uniref:Uncharacterized protein n=1 Tax=Hibiscus sabdariffa TaxID=183260 RepID=A0ABR2BL95_9ROSI
MNMFLKSEIVKLDGKDRVGDFQPSSILEDYKDNDAAVDSTGWRTCLNRFTARCNRSNRKAFIAMVLLSLKSSVPNKPTASPYPKNYESEELVDIVDDDDDCNDGLRTDKQDNASEKDVGSVAEALRDQVDTEGKEQSSSSNSSSGSDSSGSGSSSSDSESKSSDGDSAISI